MGSFLSQIGNVMHQAFSQATPIPAGYMPAPQHGPNMTSGDASSFGFFPGISATSMGPGVSQPSATPAWGPPFGAGFAQTTHFPQPGATQDNGYTAFTPDVDWG